MQSRHMLCPNVSRETLGLHYMHSSIIYLIQSLIFMFFNSFPQNVSRETFCLVLDGAVFFYRKKQHDKNMQKIAQKILENPFTFGQYYDTMKMRGGNTRRTARETPVRM